MNFYKLIANGRDVLKTSSGREYLPDMRLEVLVPVANGNDASELQVGGATMCGLVSTDERASSQVTA